MNEIITKSINTLHNNQNFKNFNEAEVKLIDKAIDFAIKKHDKQLRKSGEPYITHPLEVANILLNWGLDSDAICASILHDVVEDTNTSLNEINNNFGEVIEKLVDAVTKVSTYSNQNRANDNSKEELDTLSVIKVFLGMSKDIRVIIIKIADRLHNMRTISSLKQDKQVKIAKETKDIYANIAGRLGMYEVKTELDDICMQILKPHEYKTVKRFIDRQVNKNNEIFEEAIEKIKLCLINNHINCTVSSRIKGIYSTNEKLVSNENTNDLFAIRIVVDKLLDCYLALGVVHCNFFNMQNSIKDFISNPKINLYQSLHSIIIYKKMNIEIQIRTKDMDAIANYGVAAHWKYKSKNDRLDNDFDNLVKALTSDQNNDEESKTSSISIIKKFAKQKFINVLDKNKMQWKSILEGTTLIDYSFIANKNKFCYIKEIIVNNKVESMYYIAQPGDSIEIIYSSNKTINKHWEFISNDSTVKKYISEQVLEQKSNLESSTDKFITNIIKESNKKLSKSEIQEFIKKHFNINNFKDFLDAMRAININHNEILMLFSNKKQEKKQMIAKIKAQSWKWLMNKSLFQASDVNFFFNEMKITSCCSKIPPLDVVGCINGNCLDIHRYGCPKINQKNKMIILKWDKDKVKKSDRSFKAKFILNGYFTNNVSTLIINTITKYKGVISKFNLVKNKILNEFSIDCEVYVKNYSNLEKITNELQSKGIIHSWKFI